MPPPHAPAGYNRRVDARQFRLGFAALVLALSLTPALTPQSASGAAQQASTPSQPTFSVSFDRVTTDVVRRDAGGNFVSVLPREDFDVYEDGFKQDIVSLTLSHGGRVTNMLAAAPPAAPEGIIL